MKRKQTVIAVGLLLVMLLTVMAVYAVNRANRCDTNGVRPSECIPTNNRCTPPGDRREAMVDCPKPLYYEAK
jgi:hypothetical protein